MSTNLKSVRDELSETRQGDSRALSGHNGKNAKSIRNKLSVLSNFMADPNLLTALEKVGNDIEAFQQVKANPIAYLKGEGLEPPVGADITIMYTCKKPKKPKPAPTPTIVEVSACLGPLCLSVKVTTPAPQ